MSLHPSPLLGIQFVKSEQPVFGEQLNPFRQCIPSSHCSISPWVPSPQTSISVVPISPPTCPRSGISSELSEIKTAPPSNTSRASSRRGNLSADMQCKGYHLATPTERLLLLPVKKNLLRPYSCFATPLIASSMPCIRESKPGTPSSTGSRFSMSCCSVSMCSSMS